MAGEMAKPEGGRPRPGGTLRFPLRGLTGPRFENVVGAVSVEQFDAQTERRLAGGVVGSDLLIGLANQQLLVAGESIEAFKAPLFVDELHLPLLDALLEDGVSGALVSNDVPRLDRQGVLNERFIFA